MYWKRVQVIFDGVGSECGREVYMAEKQLQAATGQGHTAELATDWSS